MADSPDFIAARHQPPALLPIARHQQALLATVDTTPVTVLVAPTGSGKTTQLPQYLLHAGWARDGHVIAVTQPRRVAAASVAKRVAHEAACPLGHDVGYSVRFEDVTSATTRIKFLTDGLLLREALVDPLLSAYSVIMVDEAHERSLSSDVLLGVLKKIRRRRPELRIVISSATLEADTFLAFFTATAHAQEAAPGDVARVVSLPGRAFPVDIHYLTDPCEDYLERAVQTVFDIHTTEPEGDVLVFLTGRDEIERAIEMIADRLPSLPPHSANILPCPLYAGLSTAAQMYVFEPAPENTRKVICSTNIAEASVTVDGVAYVIDSGFVKLRAFNPITGIDTLTATPVSKASATQRAGRAGRTRPGKCYRLYTEAAFASLEDATVPEIQRSNLAPTILQLKALGIDNISRFEFIDPPPPELIIRALDLLYALGALDGYAKLTKPLGTRMAELALEPMLAKCLLSAQSFDCVSEMLTIAAMVSLQGNVWVTHDSKNADERARRKFAVEEGDHLTLLNVYHAFTTNGKQDSTWCRQHSLNFQSLSRAVSIRTQLRRHLERFGIDVTDSRAGHHVLPAAGDDGPKHESIRRCLTTGYFAHAARMQPDGTFRTVDRGTVLHPHPSSVMFHRQPDWLIFTHVVDTGDKTFVRELTRIEKSWLLEYGTEYYQMNGQP